MSRRAGRSSLLSLGSLRVIIVSRVGNENVDVVKVEGVIELDLPRIRVQRVLVGAVMRLLHVDLGGAGRRRCGGGRSRGRGRRGCCARSCGRLLWCFWKIKSLSFKITR